MRFSTVALALIIGLPLPVAAQVSQSAMTTANLNLRLGPGTQHAVIGQIPRGTWLRCRAADVAVARVPVPAVIPETDGEGRR